MWSKASFSSFDGNSKRDWFDADLNGLLYTWIVMLFFGAVIAGFLEVYSPQWAHAIVSWLDGIKDIVGLDDGAKVATLGVLVLSMVLAFILVFVCRWNFTVIGDCRQFRYFCRWI